MFEGRTFKTKEEIREHLFDFHKQDTELTGNETLEDLCDIGGWSVHKI